MSAADLCAALGYTAAVLVVLGLVLIALADIRRGPERTVAAITGVVLIAASIAVGLSAIWVAAGTGILS